MHAFYTERIQRPTGGARGGSPTELGPVTLLLCEM